MSKQNINSGAAGYPPKSSRRNFLSWLGGVTALGLGGGLGTGLVGLPAAYASDRSGAIAGRNLATGSAALVQQTGAVHIAVPALPIHKGGRTLLDQFKLDTFLPHLNSPFHFGKICWDEDVSASPSDAPVPAPVALELVEAKNRQSRQENRATEAFILVFRGPASQPLEQNSYEVQHAGLGTFPLFVVPIGEDDNGRYYQAIFSRLRQS